MQGPDQVDEKEYESLKEELSAEKLVCWCFKKLPKNCESMTEKKNQINYVLFASL